MERILFVDEDQDVLEGLERVLFKMRKEWEMDSVSSGEAALEKLEKQSYSAIVSELALSGITGIELMQIVRTNHPGVARIIVSAHADEKEIETALETAHQCLVKPVDAGLLKNTLLRVIGLMKEINDRNILNMVNQIHVLPSYPRLHVELQRAISKGSVKEITEIIERDPGMVVKVLQLANSPFWGMRQEIKDIAQAVLLLGVELLKGLVLFVEMSNTFSQSGVSQKELLAILDHSMEVANIARLIATEVSGKTVDIGDAFIGGIVHDIGKLVLLTYFKDTYVKIKRQAQHYHRPVLSVEQELLGIDHARLGGYLLALWGLPQSLVEIVTYHHRPRDYFYKSFSPVMAVYIANGLNRAQTEPPDRVLCDGIPGTIEQTLLDEQNITAHVLRVMEKLYDTKLVGVETPAHPELIPRPQRFVRCV